MIFHSTPSERASDPAEENTKTSCFRATISAIKLTISMVLILFSVVVVSAAILTKQTVATGENNVHPILALAVFWLSLFWLAIMEGGLNCMVGLQPISKDLYKETHPKTFRCTAISHKGQNIERFIVGRQYLDLMIVFVTSFMVSAIDDASVLGLPKILNDIFLGSDIAVILCTIVFGQLIAQINCAHSMLDFINNWGMVASTYAALCVEASGILHAVYFVQILFAKIVQRRRTTKASSSSPAAATMAIEQGDDATGSDNPSENKSLPQRIFFWVRVVFSLAISVFAIVVFSVALIHGNTTVREHIPVPVSFLSLLVLLVLGGFMEALQIALFAVKHLPPQEIEANPIAKKNCDYVLGNNNNNGSSKLQAFLVGRQIAQTVIMFMIARIITVEMPPGETMFGVSPKLQAVVFDSGLLNALVSTIFASLSWRVTANFFPMLYLGSPVSIWIIRLCLLVEGTGICDAAWTLAAIPYWIVGYKPDEEWIGSALEATVSMNKEHSTVSAGGQSETTTDEDIDSEPEEC